MGRDKFYRNLTVVLITMTAIAILYEGRSLLSPVATALVIAYILYPLVDKASRIGIPKGPVIFGIFVVMLAVIIEGVYWVIPAVKHEVVAISSKGDRQKQSKLIDVCVKVSRQMRDYGMINREVDPEKLGQMMKDTIQIQSVKMLNSLPEVAKETFQFLLIFLFVLVFALKDGDKLYKAIVRCIPNALFEPGLFMLKKTTDLFGYYIRGLIIENGILGLVSFLMLLVVSYFTPLTVPLSLAIALGIAITNPIRIIGPIAGGVIAVLLVLTTSADFTALLGVVIVVSIAQLVENALIFPLVMQEQMDLHPVICLLSIFIGGIIAGVLGMILSIPVAAGVKVIYHIATGEMKRFDMSPDIG